MVSSAQNSSGVHWWIPKVPEKVWEALVQSQARVPEKVPKKVWKAWVRTGFWRRFRGTFQEALVEPGQVQQASGGGSGEGSAEVPGSFRAEPGQVQQGSGEGSGEGFGEGSRRLWCRARSGSTGFRRRFRRRCGRLGFGAKPSQVQQGSGECSGEGCGEGSGRLRCRAR